MIRRVVNPNQNELSFFEVPTAPRSDAGGLEIAPVVREIPVGCSNSSRFEAIWVVMQLLGNFTSRVLAKMSGAKEVLARPWKRPVI